MNCHRTVRCTSLHRRIVALCCSQAHIERSLLWAVSLRQNSYQLFFLATTSLRRNIANFKRNYNNLQKYYRVLFAEVLLIFVYIYIENAHRKPNKGRNENICEAKLSLLCKTTVQALGLLVSFN